MNAVLFPQVFLSDIRISLRKGNLLDQSEVEQIVHFCFPSGHSGDFRVDFIKNLDGVRKNMWKQGDLPTGNKVGKDVRVNLNLASLNFSQKNNGALVS